MRKAAAFLSAVLLVFSLGLAASAAEEQKSSDLSLIHI